MNMLFLRIKIGRRWEQVTNDYLLKNLLAFREAHFPTSSYEIRSQANSVLITHIVSPLGYAIMNNMREIERRPEQPVMPTRHLF